MSVFVEKNAKLLLCVYRFRSISVIVTDNPKEHGIDGDYGYRISGPVSEETSIYTWPVGSNFHIVQNDIEIVTRAHYSRLLANNVTETFRYQYVSKSALDITIVVPPLKRLDIISNLGFRSEAHMSELPSITIESRVEGVKLLDMEVSIDAIGVTLRVDGIARVSGVVRGASTWIGRGTDNTIRRLTVSERAWMVPDTLKKTIRTAGKNVQVEDDSEVSEESEVQSDVEEEMAQ